MAGSGHSVSVETKVSIMSLSTGKTSQNVTWMLSGAVMVAACVIMLLAAIWISGYGLAWDHGRMWLVDNRNASIDATVLAGGDIGRVVYSGAGTIQIVSAGCYDSGGSLVATSPSSACNLHTMHPMTIPQGYSVVDISGRLQVLQTSRLEAVVPISFNL